MNATCNESWGEDDYERELVHPATAGESINCFLDQAEVYLPSECDEFRLCSQQHLNELYERMRKKLAYHFMNPLQKWNAKRRFPLKICVLLIKMIFITYQMVLFGIRSHGYVQQHRDVTMTLGHIFLLDWTPDETVYPPSTGPYAVYTIPEYFSNIDYAVKQYSKVPSIAIASFSYDSPDFTIQPLLFCVTHYKHGDIFPGNNTVTVNGMQVESCITIPAKFPTNDPRWDNFSMASFLEENNVTMRFSTLVESKLVFYLNAILPKSLNKLDVPECYRLKITILYNNHHHDGQMKISLHIDSKRLDCLYRILVEDEAESRNYVLRQILNSIVILLCIVSIILCGRSVFKGLKLRQDASEFFSAHFDRAMPFIEHLDFIDFWYVLIIISDIFIVAGSIIKIQIEEHHHGGSLYMNCSILLGLGNLLIWVGLLRYLGFFKKYNMLILTLKCALPNVLRFLFCAVLLFAGFCFCGWIVLGPYHVKFQSLSRTSECLFAVMNGDDMFATFALLGIEDPLIWWFSRIYLYLFLVLFVYVVISLFISVIMDTFETIKHLYLHGAPPKTTVELFLSASLPRPSTPPTPTIAHEDEDLQDPHSAKVIFKVKAFCAELIQRLQSL